jgi:hypothetical protein
MGFDTSPAKFVGLLSVGPAGFDPATRLTQALIQLGYDSINLWIAAVNLGSRGSSPGGGTTCKIP